MFKKVLIANRGEIALRVIRACREMGIKTVAVHSTADTDSLHVRFADEKVCIGPPPSRLSYLSIPALIGAAEVTRADAVHPGYGFLAENAHFAEVVKKCGLHWIGPRPEVMRLMGDKVSARAAMEKAGVPTLPGTGVIETDAQAEEAVERIGFPVIIKASAGGGGRGMKIVENKARLSAQLAAARSEAQAGFDNPNVYLERFISRPRHVEVQVLGDGKRAVALGERECSIQRRHQKLVEEAPVGRAGRRAAREAAGHRAQGDRDHRLRDRRHARVPARRGQELLLHGDEHPHPGRAHGDRGGVRHRPGSRADAPGGRRAAEDGDQHEPARPRHRGARQRRGSRHVRAVARADHGPHKPGGLGVRVDSHIYNQYVVPPFYDSLLAKLIVHAENRPAALARLRRALDEFVIEGIKTNIDFFKRLTQNAEYVAGKMDTHLVERM